jgi:hypothetical protein
MTCYYFAPEGADKSVTRRELLAPFLLWADDSQRAIHRFEALGTSATRAATGSEKSVPQSGCMAETGTDHGSPDRYAGCLSTVCVSTQKQKGNRLIPDAALLAADQSVEEACHSRVACKSHVAADTDPHDESRSTP